MNDLLSTIGPPRIIRQSILLVCVLWVQWPVSNLFDVEKEGHQKELVANQWSVWFCSSFQWRIRLLVDSNILIVSHEYVTDELVASNVNSEVLSSEYSTYKQDRLRFLMTQIITVNNNNITCVVDSGKKCQF